MPTLLAGLFVFLGAHLVPAVPPLRSALAARLGEQRYRAVFSLVSGLGLVLIVLGYRAADPAARLFAPLPFAKAAAPWIVTAAFVLFAASHMRGHIRRVVQHPMVVGVVLWSAVHLLANGDLRGSVLFGALLAWAVIDLIASLGRGRIAPFAPKLRHDVMALVGGIVIAGLVMAIHGRLFGVRPF